MIETLKLTLRGFFQHNVLTLSAALAFYTALSFAPLIILLIWSTSFLGEATQRDIIKEFITLTGPEVGRSIDLIIDNAKEQPSLGAFAGWVSLGLVLISASGVFLELQSALNKIWGVEGKKSDGVLVWMRGRLLSIGMVLSLIFLMLVSMILSTIVAFVSSRLGDSAGLFIEVANTGASIVIFTLLFAATFRILPNTRIQWSEVWYGALLTALLFCLGKYGIGVYLGFSTTASAYGAAGSLVVTLLWVYYSAIIFFFGAELTKVHARRGSN